MANKNQIIIYSAIGVGAVGILYLMMQSGAKTTTPPSVNAAAAAAQLKANQVICEDTLLLVLDSLTK